VARFPAPPLGAVAGGVASRLLQQCRELRSVRGRQREFAFELAVAELEAGGWLTAVQAGPLLQRGEELIDRAAGGTDQPQRPARAWPGHAARSGRPPARAMAWSRVLRRTPSRWAAWARV
jgi:hypothetical protein